MSLLDQYLPNPFSVFASASFIAWLFNISYELELVSLKLRFGSFFVGVFRLLLNRYSKCEAIEDFSYTI